MSYLHYCFHRLRGQFYPPALSFAILYLMWSGQSAGKILPEVAMELGLSSDCVVAVGAQDQKCAALGVGLGEGRMTLSLGTAGAIEKLWQEAKTEGSTAIPWSSYIQKGTWVTEEAAGAGAAMLAAQAVGEKLAPLETAKRYLPILSEEEREEKYRQYRKIEKKLWAKEDSDAAN